MTMHVEHHLPSYQGHAKREPMDPISFRRRMRLPIATLGAGLVLGLAIAGGALDSVIVGHQVTDGLSELQFLTGELPQSE